MTNKVLIEKKGGLFNLRPLYIIGLVLLGGVFAWQYFSRKKAAATV